eukprot:Seg3724.3 transcript_id=Seg3724.3/GoldUCD/mRNA.D3Y31 product="hypothetical protein" protein_id=Seg3724.3/GoldUCD/D3Y31
MRERQRETAEKVMETAAMALENISSRNEKREMECSGSVEDRCYADMILQMLNSLPDGEGKALAKVEFQQKLIMLRYRHAQQPFQPSYQPAPNMFQQKPFFTAQMQGDGMLSPSSERSTPSPALNQHHY